MGVVVLEWGLEERECEGQALLGGLAKGGWIMGVGGCCGWCFCEGMLDGLETSTMLETPMSTTLRQLRRPVSRLADCLRISSKIMAGAIAAETACQLRKEAA